MTTTAPTVLAAVAELIRRPTLAVTNGTHRITIQGQCLLAQLADAIGVGMETGGGRSVPGSKPPVAVDALDLWVEIVTSTHTWAQFLGIDRRDRHTESTTPHVGRLLRSVAATAASTGREGMTNRIEDSARTWARRITVMLTSTPTQRPVRGAICPGCYSRWITEPRGDGAERQHFREPAIALVLDDSIPWLVCRACGWNRAAVDPDPTPDLYIGDDNDHDDH